MRAYYAIILVGGLSAICTRPAASQDTGRDFTNDSVKTCEKAADIVRKGHPAHKEQAAWDALVRCGKTGAAATVTAIAQTRVEQDPMALAPFYFRVNQWRDVNIMNAASQIALDPSATVPARVFAVSHLLWLLTPGAIYSYDILTTGAVAVSKPDGLHYTPACRHGLASDNSSVTGTPLPIGFEIPLGTMLNQLAADVSMPLQVRNAAECAKY